MNRSRSPSLLLSAPGRVTDPALDGRSPSVLRVNGGITRQSSKYSRAHQAVVVQRAIEMRAALTPSEAKLRALIRAGQVGVWFRRQVPLGRFIADLAAPAARLVIEVDGGYHGRRRAADARRDQALARLGYRVLRLEAELVMGQPLEALARIREALAHSR